MDRVDQRLRQTGRDVGKREAIGTAFRVDADLARLDPHPRDRVAGGQLLFELLERRRQVALVKERVGVIGGDGSRSDRGADARLDIVVRQIRRYRRHRRKTEKDAERDPKHMNDHGNAPERALGGH